MRCLGEASGSWGPWRPRTLSALSKLFAGATGRSHSISDQVLCLFEQTPRRVFQRLNQLWESGEMRGTLTLCVVAGAVADALQAAGFEPEGEEPAGRFVLLID